ncbi:MAG: efflux RND transporter periplasmic adaptor subunit, partial [Planctomycetes bacterium]|nr:efflux RND transporter periplasmic adaptor subunit [Planctomycetota bacterium]
DIIAEFDPMYEDKQYERRLIEKKAVELELKGNLLGIDNKAQSFNDKIKEMQGRLKVLRAKLERLKSLPLESDVTIAKGKLRIAQLEFASAEDEWERAQTRFAKGFLSQTELKKYQYNYQSVVVKLDNRKVRFGLAQRPTTDDELLIAQLELDNVQLELQKIEFENEKQKKFVTINKGDAERRVRAFVRELEKTEEMLNNLTVTSPVDGYVIHSERFKNDLRNNGGKMRKGRTFMEIPHADSLYIYAALPEQFRQLVSVGNMCSISTLGDDAHNYTASISDVGTQPKDVFHDDDNIKWGDAKDSGIKIYDLKIIPEEDEQVLRPGTHSQIRIIGETRRGPAVPLRYVVIKDEQYYLSFDGMYTLVEGSPVNGWLMLKDFTLLSRTIQLKGVFPIEAADDSSLDNENGQLVISGEVSPVKEHDVIVGEIQRDTKVSELVEEGTFVEKGDVILQMDDVEIAKALTKVEEDLNSAISSREKAEEQITIIQINGDIDLKLQNNNMTMAQSRLNIQKAKTANDLMAIADRQLDVSLSLINKKQSEENLKRYQALPSDRVSQRDMVKAERDFKRKSLLYEKNEIRFYIQKHGYDYHALKLAEKNLLQQQLELESKTKRLDYDLSVGKKDLVRAKNHEERIRERHERHKKRESNLVVKAPMAGILQHKVIWDGKLSKVTSGSVMRTYMRPVSIADFSHVVVNLEVPEMAYPYIKLGQSIEAVLPSLENKIISGTVDNIKYVFKNKTRKDIQLGLYSDREPLGKSTFSVKVKLNTTEHTDIKPGMHVQVRFPVAWPPVNGGL